MEYLFGRFSLVTYTVTGSIAFAALGLVDVMFFVPAVVLGALGLLGISDYTQKKRAVLGNYPLLGRFRFIFESVRPELRQYFWESDTDELPYSRNQRAMVYQRAKGILATRPFGSDQNMYAENFNWLNHSLLPSHIEMRDFRIRVGEGDKAYDASVLNISGTSFGALSPPAIQSLSAGAKLGGFAHNTGEGSLSKYHEAGGGDTIWQISTGYFGCRTECGQFDPKKFKEKATLDQVKMIEIKLSQGAKPGHGGMLMAPKVTPEIAEARGVPAYQDVISPSRHSEFSTPNELLTFANKLRDCQEENPLESNFVLVIRGRLFQ